MAIRLGVGEYFDPAAKVPTPMADGRRFFLEAVAKVAPAVLQSLKEELLPLYEEAVDPDRVATWEGPPVLTGEGGEPEQLTSRSANKVTGGIWETTRRSLMAFLRLPIGITGCVIVLGLDR